jgi:cytochrome c oxidase cbb3-type subunit 4
MDLLNDLRAAVTVLAFIAFIGIVLWAYSRRRKEAFDEAARLPFTEDEDLTRITRIERNGK